jgi:hypothetical protein
LHNHREEAYHPKRNWSNPTAEPYDHSQVDLDQQSQSGRDYQEDYKEHSNQQNGLPNLEYLRYNRPKTDDVDTDGARGIETTSSSSSVDEKKNRRPKKTRFKSRSRNSNSTRIGISSDGKGVPDKTLMKRFTGGEVEFPDMELPVLGNALRAITGVQHSKFGGIDLSLLSRAMAAHPKEAAT